MDKIHNVALFDTFVTKANYVTFLKLDMQQKQ